MDHFLDAYYLLKLNQDQISSLDRPIFHSKIDGVITSLQTNKQQQSPGSDGFKPDAFSSEF